MEKNMGSTDRIIRVIMTAVITVLYVTKIISGPVGISLLSLSAVLLLTSFVSFCPLYRIVRFNTLKKKNA